MKKPRFTESKIIGLLKEHESGRKTQDICREHGIHVSTFYNWRSKNGGMDASQLKRLKSLGKVPPTMYAGTLDRSPRLLVMVLAIDLYIIEVSEDRGYLQLN